MEAVFTNFVFFIVFIRNCIHICFFRHGLMESSIKYSYVWFARHQFHTCTDPHQVCRVVQRSKVAAFFDYTEYFVIDDAGIGDFCAAVEYTVSDCFYFIQVLQYTCRRIYQSVKNHLDCFCMCRHSRLCNFFFSACRLIYKSSVNTDTLAQTFCCNFLCFRVNELEFQR